MVKGKNIKSAMERRNIKKLIEALKRGGVVRREKVKLKHAGISGFYLDIKTAYGYPDILDELCRRIQKSMPKTINCVAASGYGGLPLATAFALKYKLKLVLVREKPKQHGRNVWIDGYVPKKEDRVWIVDDVLTTGKSINQAVKMLVSAKTKVVGCSVIVKRSSRKLIIPCRYLMTAEDLL